MMIRLKISIFIFVLGCFGFVFAQNVSINDSGVNPHNSAGLDIDFQDKGILIPRVALQSTTDITTILNPEKSLLVYNTNANMTGGEEGFYYFDGTKWMNFKSSSGHQQPVLNIGDYYQGGVIFDLSVDDDGNQHGLIVDIKNLSTSVGTYGIYQDRPSRSSKNQGYFDWFLPTVSQMTTLRSNKTVVNATLSNISGAQLISETWHWCYNKTTSNYQYVYNISTGSSSTSIVQSTANIRVIRSF